jgi:hypothetical protein
LESKKAHARAGYGSLLSSSILTTLRPCVRKSGRGLKVPVKSLSPEEAKAHFGWLAMFAGSDLVASSALTQRRLGWHPTGPGLIADLERMNYS